MREVGTTVGGDGGFGGGCAVGTTIGASVGGVGVKVAGTKLCGQDSTPQNIPTTSHRVLVKVAFTDADIEDVL